MTLTTGRQIKAARALLGWGQQHLADQSEVSVVTIKRLEKALNLRGLYETITRVQQVLESAGIEFLNSGSPGVRAKPGIIARDGD